MENQSAAPVVPVQPKKTNKLLIIFIPLAFVCVVVGIIGGIFVYNQVNGPEQAKTYIKQNEPIFVEVSGLVADAEDSAKDIFESSNSFFKANSTIASSYTTQLEALKTDFDELIEKSAAAKTALTGANGQVVDLNANLSSYYSSLNTFSVSFKDAYISMLVEAVPLLKQSQDLSNQPAPNQSPKTVAQYEENIAFFKEIYTKIQAETDKLKEVDATDATAKAFKDEMTQFSADIADFLDSATKSFEKVVEASKQKSNTLLAEAQAEFKTANSKLTKDVDTFVKAVKAFKTKVSELYQAEFSKLGDLETEIKSELAIKKKDLGL